MVKVKKVCKYCGSDDVRKDAWAEWDEDKQEWVLADVYDSFNYCVKCEGETTIQDADIKRPEAS